MITLLLSFGCSDTAVGYFYDVRYLACLVNHEVYTLSYCLNDIYSLARNKAYRSRLKYSAHVLIRAYGLKEE